MSKERHETFSWVGVFRTMLVGIFLLVATLLLSAYTINKWFQPLYTNTQAWVETVAPLAKDESVQQALEDYIITQTFARVDVEKLIADALPEQAAFLTVPLTNVVKDISAELVHTAVTSPKFQDIWSSSNRVIHEQLQSVIAGEVDASKPVRLDMASLVGQVRDEGIQSLLPTLANTSAQRLFVVLDVQKYVPLLQEIAKYSERISQMGVVIVAFYLLGIALAKRRSYAVITTGLLILGASISLLVLVSFMVSELQGVAKLPQVKEAIEAIIIQITSSLVTYARQLAVVGTGFVLVGLFASPFRFAKSLRKLLGITWLIKKYRKTRVSGYLIKVRQTLQEYRPGIVFGGFIILILVLIFAQELTAVYIMQGISWWMIFTAVVTLVGSDKASSVVLAKEQ